jgi:hypothetical protein
VVLISCPHGIDSSAQQLDGAVEVWPCRNVVLCFFDVSGDQVIVRTVIGIDLESLYLFHPSGFSQLSIIDMRIQTDPT